MSEETRRLRFTMFALALVFVLNLTGALTHAGPRFAFASTAFTLVVMLAWQFRTRDPVMGRWLLIGFVAGWIEIATDAWLVANTATLVYPANEPLVWDSPLYMPFAWTIVLAQLGVIGGWLAQRMPLAGATLVTALLGGVNIPVYEHLAYSAGYWYYQNTPMLMHAPYYIVVSEFLLSLPLPWLHRLATNRHWGWSIAFGALAGLWMIPAVLIAWRLVGPCAGALIQFSCR